MSTSTIVRTAGFDEFSVSPTHSLYLHPSDNLGTHLVSPPFDGSGFVI